MTAQDKPRRVAVAGGGVAGLEAVLALNHIARDNVEITLIAPNPEFAYRALSVGEPFALGATQTVSLAKFAEEQGAVLRTEALATVFPDTHAVALADGSDIVYDDLIVAVGARRVPAYTHATTFRGQEDVEAMHGLVQDVEMGYVHRLACVVPPGTKWSLPLYELALMTARRAFEMNVELELHLVTPEERPLAMFGARASADVASVLEAAGIHVHCSTVATAPAKGMIVLQPSGETLECDRVVALPVIEAIHVAGLPGDAAGFLPVDGAGRVVGLEHVYAAGDGTNFPLKQGGLACQQADVAAQNIARDAGAEVEPAVFRPVLRGQLLTGEKPRFLRRDAGGAAGDVSESADHMLWWPPTKVAGRYLAPYLAMQGDVLDDREVELRGYEFATR